MFGERPPPIVRPGEVFGLAPSCGAMMAVVTALAAPWRRAEGPRHVLAAGYDLVGDGFAFVLDRSAP